jgi:hypothetical protein
MIVGCKSRVFCSIGKKYTRINTSLDTKLVTKRGVPVIESSEQRIKKSYRTRFLFRNFVFYIE